MLTRSCLCSTIISTALLLGLMNSSASALTITGDSLHGAVGDLSISMIDGDQIVTWSIDTTGFDDADAIATGHTYLTHVDFKIHGMTSVTFLNGSSSDPTIGTLIYPSVLNSGQQNCDVDGSPAGFACVVLDPKILATNDQIFSVSFLVEGDLDLAEGFHYGGKFGDDEGWVISESAAPIPEPSAALVFAAGMVVASVRTRTRAHPLQ